jgi:exosome complex RNA-binding protein Rrp42 (RNase PH superfamily)
MASVSTRAHVLRPEPRWRLPQIGSRCVADLTAEEEPCASAVLHVAVGPQGRVAGSSKAGGGGIGQAVLIEMLETAQQLGPRVIRELDSFLAASAAAPGG